MRLLCCQGNLDFIVIYEFYSKFFYNKKFSLVIFWRNPEFYHAAKLKMRIFLETLKFVSIKNFKVCENSEDQLVPALLNDKHRLSN